MPRRCSVCACRTSDSTGECAQQLLYASQINKKNAGLSEPGGMMCAYRVLSRPRQPWDVPLLDRPTFMLRSYFGTASAGQAVPMRIAEHGFCPSEAVARRSPILHQLCGCTHGVNES